jgi:dipeptidyl-peptidase-4
MFIAFTKFKTFKTINMIKYSFTVISIVLCSLISFSQKELTLEDAVLGQYSKFRPQEVFGFSWVPETDDYAYAKGYITLMKGEVNGDEDSLLTIQRLNELTGSQFQYFANVEWKDKNTIYVHQGNAFVVFHINEMAGQYIELPEDAGNFKIHKPSGKIAFTIKNNVYIADFNSVSSDNPKVKELVVVTEFEDQNIVSGQAIARSEFGITEGLFWSPDGTQLAFYQKDESDVHDYPLLNINEYPGELNSIKYPMAGLSSEKAKVGLYNLESKAVNYISPKSGEESYLTNLSWTPDGKKVLIAEVNRDQNHMWLQVYENNGDFLKTVFEEKSETWVEPERPAYFYSDSNDEFAWVSERDGYDNFYLYSIENGFIKQLTSNEFPIKSVLQSTSNGSLFFTATGVNPLNTLVYELTAKGKQKLITQEEGTHNAKVHCEGKYVFSNYSSHDTPSRSIIIKGGREYQELMSAKNPFLDYKVRPAEISSLMNEDGKELFTRLIKPYDFDSTKQYPVLVYVYGGPHAQMITNRWMDGASLWMHWLANQGYIVYTLDNRGSANRGAEFEHAIHRKLGTLELEDQLVGAEYLKSLPYVDEKRIAVHGWSFGGFMTGTMMMKASDIYNVGVAGGLVTDWKYYEIMYGERYMDRPSQNEEGYKTASLIENADKLEGDLLMIHGTADNVVVMQHNLSLVKKFVELGIQVDFFPYPMHEHNVRGKDRLHLMRKVLDYVIIHND